MTYRSVAFAGFVATIFGANWALDHYGTVDFFGLGLIVPAGVYFAGLAFGIRDVLHELGGRTWVLAAIAAGTLLSWVLEDGTIPGGLVPIAVASATAFLLSELADLAVYEPLRDRHGPLAVVASQTVGSLVDSVLFLWLAFGSVVGWLDLSVAKFLMVAFTLPLVWAARALLSDRVRLQGA